MSLVDTILSDSVGVVWRGVSGTVDPWSKNEVIDEAAAACVAAQGISQDDPDYCIYLADAKLKAESSTTNVLSQDHADTSQAGEGIKRSVTGQNANTKDLTNATVDFTSSPLAKYALLAGIGLLIILLALHFIDREV